MHNEYRYRVLENKRRLSSVRKALFLSVLILASLQPFWLWMKWPLPPPLHPPANTSQPTLELFLARSSCCGVIDRCGMMNTVVFVSVLKGLEESQGQQYSRMSTVCGLEIKTKERKRNNVVETVQRSQLFQL